jgi:hypothetical protein
MARKKAESLPSRSKPADKSMSRKVDTTAKKKSKPESPFLGRWHIVSMSTWDQSDFNVEGQAFMELKEDTLGELRFGYVQGDVDYREGEPVVEWSWEGTDGADMTPLSGRGWAVLRGDVLHGMIFTHLGDESEFEAKRA